MDGSTSSYHPDALLSPCKCCPAFGRCLQPWGSKEGKREARDVCTSAGRDLGLISEGGRRIRDFFFWRYFSLFLKACCWAVRTWAAASRVSFILLGTSACPLCDTNVYRSRASHANSFR